MSLSSGLPHRLPNLGSPVMRDLHGNLARQVYETTDDLDSGQDTGFIILMVMAALMGLPALLLPVYCFCFYQRRQRLQRQGVSVQKQVLPFAQALNRGNGSKPEAYKGVKPGPGAHGGYSQSPNFNRSNPGYGGHPRPEAFNGYKPSGNMKSDVYNGYKPSDVKSEANHGFKPSDMTQEVYDGYKPKEMKPEAHIGYKPDAFSGVKPEEKSDRHTEEHNDVQLSPYSGYSQPQQMYQHQPQMHRDQPKMNQHYPQMHRAQPPMHRNHPAYSAQHQYSPEPRAGREEPGSEPQYE